LSGELNPNAMHLKLARVVDAAFDRRLGCNLGDCITVRRRQIIKDAPPPSIEIQMRSKAKENARADGGLHHGILSFLEFWKIHSFLMG